MRDVETRLNEALVDTNWTQASLRWMQAGLPAADGFCEDIASLWHAASGERRRALMRGSQLVLLHERRPPVRLKVSMSIEGWLMDIDDGGEPFAPQGFVCEAGLLYTAED